MFCMCLRTVLFRLNFILDSYLNSDTDFMYLFSIKHLFKYALDIKALSLLHSAELLNKADLQVKERITEASWWFLYVSTHEILTYKKLISFQIITFSPIKKNGISKKSSWYCSIWRRKVRFNTVNRQQLHRNPVGAFYFHSIISSKGVATDALAKK